jgi:hypothetical protein
LVKCLQMVVYGLLVLPIIFFPAFAEEGGTGSATATGAVTETTPSGVDKPVVSASPALSPLQKAYKRNRQLRQDLRETRGKLATQTARVRSLEKKLLQKDTKPVVDDVEFANTRRASSRIREPEATSFMEVFAGFSWLWLLVSFAMLIIGFWAGVAWLRERNRKKLGGMHLRVQ